MSLILCMSRIWKCWAFIFTPMSQYFPQAPSTVIAAYGVFLDSSQMAWHIHDWSISPGLSWRFSQQIGSICTFIYKSSDRDLMGFKAVLAPHRLSCLTCKSQDFGTMTSFAEKIACSCRLWCSIKLTKTETSNSQFCTAVQVICWNGLFVQPAA